MNSNPLPSIEDYMSCLENPALVRAQSLKSGHCMKSGNITIRYAGGFCVVFPFECPTGKKAVRCWHASLNNMQERTKLISEELIRLKLPYFVNFEYVKEGICTNNGVQPIVVMDWVPGVTLKEYMEDNLHDEGVLEQLAEDFKQMVSDLHNNQLSHGDLQHGNIMVDNNGKLFLVDYDSMYVPALKGFHEEIKGLNGYQPEARRGNEFVSPKVDYFSELVIYLSILAVAKKPELWDNLQMSDSETMVFTAQDISSKGTTPIFNQLRSISGLSEMVDKIVEYSKCDSLDEISPLEESIAPQSTKIINSISGKMMQKPPVTAPTQMSNTKISEGIGAIMEKKPKIENTGKQDTSKITESILKQMNKRNA